MTGSGRKPAPSEKERQKQLEKLRKRIIAAKVAFKKKTDPLYEAYRELDGYFCPDCGSIEGCAC